MPSDSIDKTERPDYLMRCLAIALVVAGVYGLVAGVAPQSWIAAIGKEYAFKLFGIFNFAAIFAGGVILILRPVKSK